MTGPDVDAFTRRLQSEMAVLSPEERTEIIARISSMSRMMLADGQERPVWKGPAPVQELLGHEVIFDSDHGSRVGRAICFGIVPVLGTWERSVIVHVPASGTNHEVPGSMVRPAGAAGHERLVQETEMAARLRGISELNLLPPPRRAPRRSSPPVQRDPELLARLMDAARRSPNVIGIEEGSACHKIVGLEGRRIYLFRSQMRCNLAGFDIAHKAVRCLTADEARSMHLGSVRGQILFDDAAAAEEAFSLALDALGCTAQTEGK